MWRNIFLVSLIFFTACQARERLRPDSSVTIQREDIGPKVYKVERDGETLASVAHRFTGSAANWRLLAKENPQITNPRLKRGEEVYIPQALLVENQSVLTQKKVRKPQQEVITQPVTDRILMDQPAPPVAREDSRRIIGVGQGESVTIIREEPQKVVEPTIVPQQYRQIRNDLIDEFINDSE